MTVNKTGLKLKSCAKVIVSLADYVAL